MSRSTQYTSPGYRRAVRMDQQEWIISQVRERDEAARKAVEAEKAAVLAELERAKPKLIDLLPSPKEAAKEGTGPTDGQTSAAWLYGENGKAPR